MLWACSTEVMEDMWRARFGTERVAYHFLYNEKQGGDMNDWPYVARLLSNNGRLRRTSRYDEAGIVYQLKE